MAKLNLFGAVAAMEEEDIGTSSSVANGDVAQNEVENIEAQNEVEEVAKLSSEIEQVASQIEEGIDEGEKLDEAIVEGEEVLENNEGGDVPEEAVEVAQEALSESILLLAGREGKKQFKPSLESYETNIQKLRVSLEAAKDFANNVWQKIKELFAKFMVMIKKYAFKIGAMFDKGVKQAEALAKIFKQRTVFDSAKVTDEFKERLAKAYPVAIKINGLGDLITDMALDDSAVENTKTLGKLVVEGLSTSSLTENASALNYIKRLGGEPELKNDSDDGKEVLVMAVPKRYTVWYIGSQGTTGTVKADVSSSDISNVPDYGANNLVSAANNIKNSAKAYKTAVKNVEGAISKASKEIDKIRDADLKGALDYEEKANARKRANITYKVATQSGFQILSGIQETLSGSLAILSILSTAYKKA